MPFYRKLFQNPPERILRTRFKIKMQIKNVNTKKGIVVVRTLRVARIGEIQNPLLIFHL